MDTNTMDTNTMDPQANAQKTYADKVKVINTCKYNNICSTDKICGDCGGDLFEAAQEAEKEEKLERRIWLRHYQRYY